MRILGIDPGTRVAGYGIVDLSADGKSTIVGVAAGAWRLDAKLPLSARLGQLAIEFRRVLDAYSPQILCLELAFMGENARSALFLGHARGVVMAEAHLRGLVIHEISATSAKKMITNYGRADKHLVAQTLSGLLGLSFEKLPYDASDALGIAYAQALRERQGGAVPSSRVDGARGAVGSTSVLASSQASANAEGLKTWATAEKKKSAKNKKGFEVFLQK